MASHTKLVSVLLGGLFGAALLTPLPAAAHAAYESSNPADDSTVSSTPSSVTAKFTEPLSDSSYLKVFDPCGAQVDDGAVAVSGYDMSVGMSSDKAGTFVVEYFALSTLDGHGVNGQFTFTASSGAACPGSGGDGGGGGGSKPQPRGGSGSGQPSEGSPAGSGTAPPTGPMASGGTEPAAGVDGASDRRRRQPSGGKTTKPRRHTGINRDPKAPTAEIPALAGDVVAAEGTAPADGMPVDGLLTALALSALIGFGGGRIYTGLIGGQR